MPLAAVVAAARLAFATWDDEQIADQIESAGSWDAWLDSLQSNDPPQE